MQKA
jgi:hypothetical protein